MTSRSVPPALRAARARACALLPAALAALLMGASQGTAPDPPAKGAGVAGTFLVATPAMPDPRFARTVIYMVRHDASGAMGLVVNRPAREVPLAELMRRLGIEGEGGAASVRVHWGGPVETGRGFVLHTAEYAVEGTLTVRGGMALTWQPDVLRALAAGTGPRRSLFALGYAGWGPGQLEGEMAGGHWVSVPADEALVFGDDAERKWERAFARRKIDL